LYEEKIATKTENAVNNVWGFIDGTVKKIHDRARTREQSTAVIEAYMLSSFRM
jgi:hypothetical protein